MASARAICNGALKEFPNKITLQLSRQYITSTWEHRPTRIRIQEQIQITTKGIDINVTPQLAAFSVQV